MAGVTGIQPELWVDRTQAAIDFYTEAFGATVLHQVGDGDDIVAQLAVGDAAFWVSAANPDAKRFSPAGLGGGTGRMLLVVEDPDGSFTRALAACRPGSDDDYAAEALRHLGGCAQAAGDLTLARERWERSAALAGQAGWLPLVLAQQALLADLSADQGDLAGARTLAAEVHRWATALHLTRLATQAEAILSR